MNLPLERRRDTRLNLKLDVEFTPATTVGVGIPLSGISENVSAGGIFFKTAENMVLKKGMNVLLQIVLPKKNDDERNSMVLRCIGTICRIENLGDHQPSNDRLGVAVRFNNKPNVEIQSLDDHVWNLQ